MLNSLIGRLDEDGKKFYKILLTISIPIVIQNFLTSSVNMVDNLMIGRLGEESIAAVGVANQMFFLYSLICFGLNSGASIFYAQYYGSKDHKSLHRYMGMAMVLGIFASILFSVLAIIFPGSVIRVFTDDPVVIREGVNYLRVVGFSYVLNSLSFAMVFALRATNQAMVPMFSTIVALATNTVLNLVLINGLLGFPRLGVTGAAIGTLVARILEFGLLFFIVFVKENILKTTLTNLVSFTKADIRNFFRITAPVILNEAMWSVGIVMYNFSYAKIGVASFAAIQVANVISQLFYVFAFGVCNAAAIMVGNQIGEGRYDLVKDYSKKIVRITLVIGLSTSLMITMLKTPILGLYNLDAGTLYATRRLLTIVSLIVPLRFFNILFVVGFFRGGGDTKFSLFAEIISLWGIGVPVVALSAIVFRLPVETVYLLSVSEEIVKFLICFPRYKSRKWFRRVI